MGWPPHTVEPGDVVLVWGAAGGLGSMALEITRALGGRAVAVVSDEAKREFCVEHGAVGVINRNDFKHWGPMPDTKDAQGVRRVGQGRARLRQGRLGRARRADEPAHRVRASGRGDAADLGVSSAPPAG